MGQAVYNGKTWGRDNLSGPKPTEPFFIIISQQVLEDLPFCHNSSVTELQTLPKREKQ